jgi:hypothetical protein
VSEESISVPIEYLISTTSDWTTFQIIEGGWWSNIEVECLKGLDRLRQEVLFNAKTIAISKNPNDTALVEARARCNLNIDKRYSDSYISYLITKGDLPSTILRIIVNGKEIHKVENSIKVAGNPFNPLPFNVTTKLHLSAIQPQSERAVQAEKKEVNPIATAFRKNFDNTFQNKNPENKDVEEVFSWLRSHGKYARTFLDTEIYEQLTLEAETHFMRFGGLKNKVCSEVPKTLEEISNRYDKLRETYGKLGLQIPLGFGGAKEEKKVTPSK